MIGGGLALAAVGLGLLTQVGVDRRAARAGRRSVVISLGMAPVFGLTTELIVGSAPPERAGAASGISETGAELGGALGIAVLGSIGVAIYRGAAGRPAPGGRPGRGRRAARDTLGGATAVAAQLPGDLGQAVLQAAQEAFVAGMRLSSAIAAGIGVGLAILALIVLRKQEPTASEGDETPELASAGR